MIIDTHTHIGTCRVFDADQSPDALFAAIDGAGVDAVLVQPYPGSPDPVADHDAIAEMGRQRPGRVFGMASLNPHGDEKAYRAELSRCVTELGFVGVKVHPIGHAVAPGSRDGEMVFRTAAELGIAVMVHTGPGVPFAEPAAWIPTVRAYPDTRVVFGHGGAGLFTGAAIGAATVCPNLYLETSWCNAPDIRKAINVLGSDRVMFGSDVIPNLKPELAKYDAAGLSAAEREAVFELTARTAYGLPGRPE